MIKEGTIIEGPYWKEPVEVTRVEPQGRYVRIIGAGIYTRDYIDITLTRDEIEAIKTVEYALDFSGNGKECFLALEAIRFKNASLFDPLLAMNVSRIDPLPFQIEAVYGYILRLPTVRFLIADDPGAGKTIMAGLVIKELKLRGLAKRILVVVPGHLKDQWKRELYEKFNEAFVVVDRGYFAAHFGENPWNKENQIITSIDFAKQEEILASLQGVEWDLVIVDEAHKMAAYRYGNRTYRTERYKLGEILSRNATHLLFLTATPHKGDPENFRLLLDLLIPGFFATKEMINESLVAGDNPLFIRRMKEDLKDFEGKPIFTPRHVKTVTFKLSEKEKELYNELSNYVISQYNRALQLDSKRNIAFALLILQRRMASSTYALFKSLERRKKRLEEILEKPDLEQGLPAIADIEDVEDYNETERWEEEKKWETLTVSRTIGELKNEIETIERLIDKARDLLSNEEEEVKLRELKKAIKEGLEKIREMNGNEKILIFTESKDTMEYLVEKITKWGYSVSFIHGGMKLEERIQAEKEFKQEKQIMVATEAAGEGINLQFCHLMINYDIPWNPNRLEQRMGRIHRYGQQKEVHIFNLVAQDTREGMVLWRLFEKLEEIRKAVGSDKVFDVIGNIFLGKDLSKLVIEAVASTRNIEEILNELEINVDEKRIREIRELLGESLATKHIDYTRIKDIAEKAREQRLIPEYVQRFFLEAFSTAGGSYRNRRDGFISIENVPFEIRKFSEQFDFKRRFGDIAKRYEKVTFDKETAYRYPESEFISFGHPLFEATLKWVHENFRESLLKGASFIDPEGRYNGVLWFFEAEVKDGKGRAAGKKVFALYEKDGVEIREVNPSVIWDLVPQERGFDSAVVANKEKAQVGAIEVCEKYKEEILKERMRQAKVKEKYGIKSLEKIIRALDLELVSLYEKREKGEHVKQLIDRKEEKKKRYEEALQRLKEEIRRETVLSISTPRLITAIAVKPSEDDSMVSDEEIERIGMKVAMEYEKSQGRQPEDVSKENLGFDIRSRGENEIRYIEVKARKDQGRVALTLNELIKAMRFQDDYWLYVVCNAATKPELYIIRNPVQNLKINVILGDVRVIIDEKEWKEKGEKA